ncbi:hypothetical protein Nepgr_008833 [Nepenthes gracilis]|uniref:Uncharacterized protein n=1 Tax=Nepenthes gracilis TaxID=150966 RepID=A0AAD3S9D4_NEPGR|nr:hypothetical protein Nepgr_008833 [Nepenthes gracilis]
MQCNLSTNAVDSSEIMSRTAADLLVIKKTSTKLPSRSQPLLSPPPPPADYYWEHRHLNLPLKNVFIVKYASTGMGVH